MITLGNGYRQVLSVRFANYDISEFNKLEFPGGFLITVGPAKNILESKHLIELKVSDVIFTVVPFVLALLHFVMFIFYPRNKQNLYYSICLLGFTFMAVLNYMNLIFNTASPLFGLTLLRFFYVAVLIAALFGLLTTYSSLYKKLPRQYLFFTIAAIILGIWGMFDRSDIQGLFNRYLLWLSIY